jgi:hypothetical protein
MANKKELERHFVRLVAKARADFPQGEIIDGDEPPDFFVQTPSGLVGIEVARILDEAAKREDTEREKVLYDAMGLAREMGLPPLQVSVLFGYDPPLRRADRALLARRIAEIVASKFRHGEYSDWSNRWDDLSVTPAKLAQIHIIPLPVSAEACWSPLSAGWLNSDFAPQLQKIIDNKSAGLAEYSNICAERWLIVAAEGFQPSSLFAFSGRMASYTFSSTFDRAFFVEGFHGRVDEIKLRVTDSPQPIPEPLP